MQNPRPKFRQSSIVSEKPGSLLKKWELLRAPTTIEFNIFCWNFTHFSCLTMSTKACSGFFFISFRSWVINKNIKNLASVTLNLNKIKKSQTPFCRHW